MGAESILYKMDPRKIQVTQGDIQAGFWELSGCSLVRSPELFANPAKNENDCLQLDHNIAKLELKNIENANQTANMVGIGLGALAGLRFFGPIGAIGGAVAGQVIMGNRHELTVEILLQDGRHFTASMDKAVYERFRVISQKDMENN